MTDQELDSEWFCAAFEPPSERPPFRCSLPYGHELDHEAVIDGVVVARWPRLRDTTTEPA